MLQFCNIYPLKINGLNKDDYIYPNQEILIPKNNYSYYVTKDGDTMNLVSNKFNQPVSELLAHNETIYLLPEQMIFYKINKKKKRNK